MDESRVKQLILQERSHWVNVMHSWADLAWAILVWILISRLRTECDQLKVGVAALQEKAGVVQKEK